MSIEQEIIDKCLTAPRVTPDRIEEVIESEHYFTADAGVCGEVCFESDPSTLLEDLEFKVVPQSLSLLTFCVLVIKNGFTVTGESACASPENFDAEIGRKRARGKAVEKILQLEAYLLKQKLSEAS